MGVFPITETPTDFHSQKFWWFISSVLERWVVWSVSLPSCSSCLSTGKCGTTQSTSHRLAECTLCPSCLSLLLLPVWVNVSSSTPWLSDCHTVFFLWQFWLFLFLNLLLSFLRLCKETIYIYLCLHLGRKSLLCGLIPTVSITHGFSFPLSTMVQKYQMKGSRNKPFIHFKLLIALSILVKSCATMLCPAQDINYAFSQYIYTVHTVHTVRHIEISHCYNFYYNMLL